MTAGLQLDEMSVEEKIRTMEPIWDDLRARAGGVTSPAWHNDVLADRHAALERGQTQFEDWKAAKKHINQEIS